MPWGPAVPGSKELRRFLPDLRARPVAGCGSGTAARRAPSAAGRMNSSIQIRKAAMARLVVLLATAGRVEQASIVLKDRLREVTGRPNGAPVRNVRQAADRLSVWLQVPACGLLPDGAAVQIGLAHCWAQVWPVVRSAEVGHRDSVMAARHAGVVERGGQVNQSDVGVKESEQRDTAAQQNRRTGKHDVVDQAAAEPVRNDFATIDIDRCRASLSEQRQRFLGGCCHSDSRVVGGR